MSYSDEVQKRICTVFLQNSCLWDSRHNDYNDRQKRLAAWDEVRNCIPKVRAYGNHEYQQSIGYTKNTITNLKRQYRKEAIKIKKAKEKGYIRVPKYSYFPIAEQVFKDDENVYESGADQSSSEEESPSGRNNVPKREKIGSHTNGDIFGLYVTEQLATLNPFQRHVAEKLISETLFLAKTGNLHYESKIDYSITSDNLKEQPSSKCEKHSIKLSATVKPSTTPQNSPQTQATSN